VTSTDEYVTSPSESDAVTPTFSEMPGVRAGAVLLVGIAAANLGNYAFHLLAARALGPADYGDVASLVAIAGLIGLPLGGVQIYIARSVAARAATSRADAIATFARRALVTSLGAGAVLTLALLLLAPLVRDLLDIDSLTAVILTALMAAPAVAIPPLWGLAQGLQRFITLSVSTAIGPVARIVAAAVLLVAGFGVPGVMAASLLGATAGLLLPLWTLRSWFRRHVARASSAAMRRHVSDITPVVLGLLAITSLTTIDVVVAKIVLAEDPAGIYGSASLVGRVILYLPAAIVTVLLPKVSSRAAADRSSSELLANSLLVTAAFSALTTAIYALLPSTVVHVAFGSDFENVGPLLWMFGLAMTAYALLNVLLTYHLALRSASMSYLLLGGAVAQLGAFVLFHDSARELLWVSISLGVALLVVHELFIERSLLTTARVIVSRPSSR
jgi:O-antigen/teichoic acid export membrane protein